ncbi:MAG: DUF2950 family protein, partial [Lysobacterales bacterium]
AIVVIILALILAACAKQSPTVFDTPEAAIQTLSDLITNFDAERVEEAFGPGSLDMFSSGDAEQDHRDFGRVNELIAEAVAFEEYDENTLIALLGKKEWPWPIPLVHGEKGWTFDSAEGREELLNRRIGRNELWTLTTLHEIVDAEREYHMLVRDGEPPAYARRFISTEGQRDGLYWEAADDSDQSPLGSVLAGSEATTSSSAEPSPFKGYFYRILTSQGENAPGGVKEYLDESGFMTGGFAVLAWPSKYGNSGVMSFLISQNSIAFQKDLGADTEQAVTAIQGFDPDDSWAPTADSLTEVDEE